MQIFLTTDKKDRYFCAHKACSVSNLIISHKIPLYIDRAIYKTVFRNHYMTPSKDSLQSDHADNTCDKVSYPKLVM